MRNHRYIDEVYNAMISFNSNEYISDIDDLVNTNSFNQDINIYLANISNLLNTHLQQTSNFNNNLNLNNMPTNYYDIVLTRLKNSIKTNLFRILTFNDGRRCCDKLACINQG